LASTIDHDLGLIMEAAMLVVYSESFAQASPYMGCQR